MVILSLLGLLLSYGISLQSVLVATRDPRQGRRVRSVVWALGSFTVGSLFLAAFFYFYEADPVTPTLARASLLLTWLALGLSALGLLGWIFVLIWRRRAAAPTWPSLARVPLRERITYLVRLTLPGWRSLSAPEHLHEDTKEASRTAATLAVTAAVVAVPTVIVLIALAIMLNIRGSAASDFASRTLGYYTLLIASCWTVIYLLTLIVTTLLQILRGNGRQLDFTRAAITVGTWAGLGAAGGVFVGALIPVVVIVLPGGPFASLDTPLLDAISPELLLNTSATGAIFGFLLGEIISLPDLSGGEDNLILGVGLPPVLFGTLASLGGWLGLRPGALSAHLAAQYRVDVLAHNPEVPDPFTTATNIDLDSHSGWATLVEAFDRHGWNLLVDSRIYFFLTWMVVHLVVLFALTLRLHQRELELVSLDSDRQPH